MFLLENPIYIGIVVVIVAVVFGFSDLARFRMRRVNAIAGVCFAESIRRRVLWITPLAILGVIVVSALQKPMDEQDAIRQTTKYCLFATGLIVTVAAIILACTNLPKEIENRVIFTIVTKPTTRLEIVLGKVLGFARVSALILLIMGVFTWGYLQLRSAALLSHVRTMLASGELEAGRRSTLEHYQSVGLLSTKSMEMPADVELGPEPFHSWDKVRWVAGGQAMYYSAPFALNEGDRQALSALLDPNTTSGAALWVELDLRRHAASADERNELKHGFPTEPTPIGPALPGAESAEAKEPKWIPQVSLEVTNSQGHQIAADVNPQYSLPDPRKPRITPPNESTMIVMQPLTGAAISDLLKAPDGKFAVEVQGMTPTFEYGAAASSTRIQIFDSVAGPGGGQVLQPGRKIQSSAWGAAPHETATPKVLGKVGRSGMQLVGRAGGSGSLASYRFHDVEVPKPVNGKVALQVKVSVERSGDLDAVQNTTSEISLQVHNLDTNFLSDTWRVQPETGLASYAEVPVEAVAPAKAGEKANFEVLVRGMTPGSIVNLQGQNYPTPSVTLVTADHSFTFNLFKSLCILWLLSVLVVAVSVFCSTFLSWPIAIVLTLLLLLGHWGVDALGGALDPGAMRGVGQDLFGIRNDPSRETAVTDTLEVLSTVLRNAVKVLPDVERFPAFEDIERGVDIRPGKVGGALAQTLAFGVPVILMTYLVLKRKEVAP